MRIVTINELKLMLSLSTILYLRGKDSVNDVRHPSAILLSR